MTVSDVHAGYDQEANVFAAYLLMPTEIFAKEVSNGLDLNDDKWLERMSRKYRVPIGAVVFRMMLWARFGE